MNRLKVVLSLLAAFVTITGGTHVAQSQEKPAGTVDVHMVITDEAIRGDSELAILRPENIQVKQGKGSFKSEPIDSGPWRERGAAVVHSHRRYLRYTSYRKQPQ